MSVQGPVWCLCKRHSWTRKQLLSAWEAGRSLYCPDVACSREIVLESIRTILLRLKLIPEEEEESDGHPES